MKAIDTVKSEVERNAELIRINDVLYYTDGDNCQKFIVSDLFEGGFEANEIGLYDAEDDSEIIGVKDFYFNELQFGWEISRITKSVHMINDRFIYN